MESRVKKMLESELGDIAPVVVRMEKEKMGIQGDEIPDELKEQFIEGVVSLCKSELDVKLSSEMEEKLRSSVETLAEENQSVRIKLG